MSHTIRKYAVQLSAFTLELPDGARFLSVQIQHGQPQMWFLVNADAPGVTRKFMVIGTGHEVPKADHMSNLGTFQMLNGDFVGHLFEYV